MKNSIKNTNIQNAVWIGWISSVVEAYNMAIYSFVAPFLAILLFQNSSSSTAITFSYALVFVGSCLFFPLGSIYFGSIGDLYGRQKICVYSTLGLALATGAMGLFPFELFGNGAWIYFLLLICAQNFFSGGEYQGSIVFSLEHAEKMKGGFISSVSCLSAVIGLVVANGFATMSLLSGDAFWIRICFLFGAFGGLVSYLIKYNCQETPAFSNLQHIEPCSWGTLFKTEWRAISSTMLVFSFFIVSYNFIFIFLPLVQMGRLYQFDTMISLIGYGLFLLLAGWFADRIGIEKMIAIGLSLFSVVVLPLCYLCQNLLVLQIGLMLFACMVIGPIHSWALGQFKVAYRCRGIFISCAIAISLFNGGTVPLCLMIFEGTQSLAVCSLFPLAIAFAALFYVLYQNSESRSKVFEIG